MSEKKGLKSVADLAKFQVARDDYFSSSRFKPTVSIKGNQVTFNSACFKAMEGVEYIQILINPEDKQMVILPSKKYDKDALQWNRIDKHGKLVSKNLTGKFFAAKLFDMMGWNQIHRYKVEGLYQELEGGTFILYFDLSDYQTFVREPEKTEMVEKEVTKADGTVTKVMTEVKKRVTRQFFPENWRDSFGLPFEEHRASEKLDLEKFYVLEAVPIKRGQEVRDAIAGAVDRVTDTINGVVESVAGKKDTQRENDSGQMNLFNDGSNPVMA